MPALATPPDCPGEPLKFTTIAALTSPLGNNGDRARMGTDAAVRAVNRECSLGRPIEVDVLRRHGRRERATSPAAGRPRSNGSLAILSFVGSFDDGATASGLPALYLGAPRLSS